MSLDNIKNVGILDIECYFPNLYVSQNDLEIYNNVSKGKYTKGLMQKNIAVPSSCEDIVSMSMNALDMLIKSSGIEYNDIGRLTVGTESQVDKSKSIKTYLMELFGNNKDVLGVDYINACYGGTAALFDSYSWIHSPIWDGKYAVVITGDIAMYKSGPARPTGGAGVCAMLIGPEAPIKFTNGITSYFENAYDFYKPNMNSEYPIVDGKYSNECYIRAIDNCYNGFSIKNKLNIQDFDYSVFHAPYGKMVYKAYEQLMKKDNIKYDNKCKKIVNENTIRKELYDSFLEKVNPGLFLSSECGNMYTGSVYACIYSLLSQPKNKLVDKDILVFSYGSGLASSMFSLKITDEINKYDNLSKYNKITKRLNNRKKISPMEYEILLNIRENKEILDNKYLDGTNLFKNSYYLSSYDNKHRRGYSIRKYSTSTSILRYSNKIMRFVK